MRPLPSGGRHLDPSDNLNVSGACWQLFSDRSMYTVSNQDAECIHQYAVDAYEAQHAGRTTRSITVIFGFTGLYLALEKGYTGKQVQWAHSQIAKVRKDRPLLEPPHTPECITINDVLEAPGGPEKDAMIRQGIAAVGVSGEDSQEWVRETTEGLIGRVPE